MSELIQWPRAKYWTATFNPIIGCKPCSPACENCYAAAWAKRFGQSFEPHMTKQKPPRKGVVFLGNLRIPFCTIRRAWPPSKVDYYKSKIGEQFEVMVKPVSGNEAEK